MSDNKNSIESGEDGSLEMSGEDSFDDIDEDGLTDDEDEGVQDEHNLTSEDDDLTDEEEEEEECVQDEDLPQQKEVPQDIKLKSAIINISCHPKTNLIAAGTIDGPVHLYSYDTDKGNKEILTYEYHKKFCRAVKFSPSGDYLFTGSQDTVISVIDLETQSQYRKFCRTNGSALYCLLPIDNNHLASGEDDGQVVIWDFRMESPVAVFEDCSDYISSLTVNKGKKTLLATSGDGVLAAYNIRRKKKEMLSDLFDCDFFCCGLVKEESKVVVGTGDGSLNIFNWGEYGSISDRFPGHPGPVDCMAVLCDDVVCTGCEDGKVRAVQLFPSRFLGVLGQHNGFSVESLDVTHDSAVLASSSHDQTIKFWDLSSVEKARSEDVKDTKKKHIQLNKQVNSFFADL